MPFSNSKLTEKLEAQNRLISKQNEQIGQMNELLKLKVLQARMNPHFLFNSLNSIQYFITAGDMKASLQYISRFSAFLRKVIHFGDELSILVSDEAALLKEYLWLEHSRFPDKFEYEITIPDNAQQASILPLLTHGLVEEALYKGVLNLNRGNKGKLLIAFELNKSFLTVTVTDNGIKRKEAAELEIKKSLGPEKEDMLTRRIKLFNRQEKRKIVLKITADENRNEANLQIPQPLFKRPIL